MGLQKKETSKASIAPDNAGSLPNLLSSQRRNNGADKTSIPIGKAQSLSLWRTVAQEKKIEEARAAQQRHSEKERFTKETTLSRALGLSLAKAQAVAMDDVSEDSTTCFSNDKENQLEPLLWVSAPRFHGDTTRQFDVTIGRSSTKQRFGLTFKAEADGKIVIAADAKQFGVIEGDIVLGVNGYSQSPTVEKFMRMMKSSLKIELSLLRIAHVGQISQGKILTWPINRKSVWNTRQGVRCVDLLAVSPQQPCGPEDQFILTLSRATCHLKFGLDLRSVNVDPTGHDLTSKVYCAEDMLHLGLKKDDHILSINGHAITNVTECQHILDTSMSVELLLQRVSKKASEEPSDWNPENFEMTEQNWSIEATTEDDWMVPSDEWDEPMVCAPKRSII